jgi:outer membrane protein OmpA-like peptidoglycan-associated protein
MSRMVLRGARFRKDGRGWVWLAALLLFVGLSACSPIDTYRHIVGYDKNDPDPATTPNTRNLAAGEARDYPNLATVPPPPSRAMSTAERKQLTQSLVADRSNANYTGEKLTPGFSPAGAPPPPPPPPPADHGATAAVAAPPPPPPPPPTLAGEEGAAAAAAKAPPRSPAAPSPPAAAAAPAGVPFAGSATRVSASASPAATAGDSSGAPPPARRKMGEPPEPGPMESSLHAPEVSSRPQPGQPRPPPAAPPQVSWTSVPPEHGPSPTAMASARPQPPPAPPTFAPPPRPAPARGKAKATIPFVTTTIATVDFARGSKALGPADRQTLTRAAALFKQNPGMIRVVAYAAATAAGAGQAQLASFQTALDRAQVVAAVLTRAGVPAAKVQTQAAPAEIRTPVGRVEVRLMH